MGLNLVDIFDTKLKFLTFFVGEGVFFENLSFIEQNIQNWTETSVFGQIELFFYFLFNFTFGFRQGYIRFWHCPNASFSALSMCRYASFSALSKST